MWISQVIGHVGKDPEKRAAGNTTVVSFSVATTKKVKGEDQTSWIRCSGFGERWVKLMPHIRKGDRVMVSGETTTREYEGKTYVELEAQHFAFAGGKREAGKSEDPKKSGGNDYPEGLGGNGDDVEEPY